MTAAGIGPETAVEPLGYPEVPGRPVRRSRVRAGGQQSVFQCGGCTARWTALGAAHCSGCHQTFAGVGMFDAHRSQYGERGRCLEPDTLAGVEFRDGMWRGPEATPEQRAALAARRAKS